MRLKTVPAVEDASFASGLEWYGREAGHAGVDKK
jgi:hypothetical protein